MGILESVISGLPDPPPWKLRPDVLLCANTVKPMHGVVPRIILGAEWWNDTRQAAYASTNYHCVACGVHKSMARQRRWLEGHELYKTNYCTGRMVYVETVPLCHYCHNFIHDGRLEALRRKGEVTEDKFKAIIDHGRAVLAKVGLKKKRPYSGPIAPWGEWRLVLMGKEYPPIYRSYRHWLAAFNKGAKDE